MKILKFNKGLLIAVGILGIVATAHAWLRGRYSEAQVVSRAELIVVGKIKPSSIVLVPHDPKNNSKGWEHHVELQISEVLKGQAPSNSMVISIHYGLDPGDGHGRRIDVPWSRFAFTNDVVEIWDSGTSDMPSSPVASDIQTNHIWLLHRETHAANFDTDWIGIYDPEDIRPVSQKDELLKYLKTSN